MLDEADRLLGNAYHHWVRALIHSSHKISATSNLGLSSSALLPRSVSQVSSDDGNQSFESSLLFPPLNQPIQRLLFSATLTDNPSKLALLGIRNPIIIRALPFEKTSEVSVNDNNCNINNNTVKSIDKSHSAGDSISYSLPATLTEAICTCDTQRRPLILAALLAEALGVYTGYNNMIHPNSCVEGPSMCLVFSSSVETTHRLCLLLQIMNGQLEYGNSTSESTGTLFGGYVAEMSRLVRAEEREKVMTAAANGQVKVLVSSDHMARGIDLPNVRLVINYDPPTNSRTYVHRAGRTARANRSGHCITMLKIGQIGSFRKIRSTIVSKEGIEPGKCKPRKEGEVALSTSYKRALKLLPNFLK